MDLIDSMDAAEFNSMTRGRQFLRFLFFVAEAGTVVGAIIFTMFDRMMNSHPANPAFDSLRWSACILLFALPVVSVFLRRTDRDLASIGFLTFLAVLFLGIFFPSL